MKQQGKRTNFTLRQDADKSKSADQISEVGPDLILDGAHELLTHGGQGNLVKIHRALPDNKQGQFPKTVLLILILKSNRNLGFFPARIAPCFVEALDHICPLCSAGFASPDTILSRKSFPIFLLEFNISFLQKCFKGEPGSVDMEPGSVDMDNLFRQIHGLHAGVREALTLGREPANIDGLFRAKLHTAHTGLP